MCASTASLPWSPFHICARNWSNSLRNRSMSSQSRPAAAPDDDGSKAMFGRTLAEFGRLRPQLGHAPTQANSDATQASSTKSGAASAGICPKGRPTSFRSRHLFGPTSPNLARQRLNSTCIPRINVAPFPERWVIDVASARRARDLGGKTEPQSEGRVSPALSATQGRSRVSEAGRTTRGPAGSRSENSVPVAPMFVQTRPMRGQARRSGGRHPLGFGL